MRHLFLPISRAKSITISDGLVCVKHRRDMELIFPSSVICSTRCRCNISPADVARYEKLISDADKATTGQMELSVLLDIIDVCDDDPQLHTRLLILAKQEEVLSKNTN